MRCVDSIFRIVLFDDEAFVPRGILNFKRTRRLRKKNINCIERILDQNLK
jgi:hypothetical protein